MPTIYDVAQKARVSVGTVSNVINGKASVSPKLRIRVEAAMQAIGYVPNHAARSLAKGKTNCIGVFYPFDPDYRAGENYIEFASLVTMELRKHGHQAVLFPAHDPNSIILETERVVDSGQVDGVILFEVEMLDERASVLKDRGIPFVMLGRCANNDGLAYVDADVEQIISEAVQHIVGRGYRRVAHLGRKSSVAVDLRIYHNLILECQQAGLNVEQSLFIWSTGKASESDRAVNHLLTHRQEYDVIFISEPMHRFRFVQEALRNGIDIPGQVAVMGYMGGSLDEVSQPSITAFDVQPEVLVEEAVHMLLDICAGRDEGRQVLVPGSLIVRESTEARD